MLNYLKKLVKRDSTADKRKKILHKEGIEKSKVQKRSNQRGKLMQEWSKKSTLCSGYDKGWTKQIKHLHSSSLLFNEVQSCQQKRKCHQMSATE